LEEAVWYAKQTKKAEKCPTQWADFPRPLCGMLTYINDSMFTDQTEVLLHLVPKLAEVEYDPLLASDDWKPKELQRLHDQFRVEIGALATFADQWVYRYAQAKQADNTAQIVELQKLLDKVVIQMVDATKNPKPVGTP